MFEPEREKESKVSSTVFSYLNPKREKTLKDRLTVFHILIQSGKNVKDRSKFVTDGNFPPRKPKL